MKKGKHVASLKLKQLMGLAFGALLAILLLLGAVSTRYIQSISNNTEVLYDRPHTNLVGMWEAKARISQTGNGLREAALYGGSMSEELVSNFTAVGEQLRTIEGNKVDKNAPMSDDMKSILDAVDAWAGAGQEIRVSVQKGESISRERLEEYTALEQDAVNRVDTIIQTASNNAFAFKNTAMKSASNSLVIVCVIFIAAIAVTVLMLGILMKRIISPIGLLLSSARDIEQGHLDSDVSYWSEDEFGELAESFRQMQVFLKHVIADVTENLVRMGKKDFRTVIKADYRGEFKTIRDSINTISEDLNTTLMQINQSADMVASGSGQMSEGAQMLSQGATEQASSVEELAATVQELSDHVKQNAGRAAQASETAGVVGEHAKESSKRMSEMLQSISEISSSSKEIGKIIKTIEDIAFQTNILALNAAVEAARAGEAGKGFAVVANEVRNLASKSAMASKDTADLIEGSLKAVEHGTRIADDTARSMNQVLDGVKEVTGTIGEISGASEEQSCSLAQVTLAIDQISNVVQSTSASAEESAASSIELAGQARTLKGLVQEFTLRE